MSFNYDQLPPEIIIKIFGYLPFNDLKNASLTSKYWLSSSLDSSFTKKRVLRLFQSKYHQWAHVYFTLPVDSIKMSCNTTKKNSDRDCLTDMEFWKRIAGSLKFLEIDELDQNDWHHIFEILSNLENLESLCLNFNYKGKARPNNTTSLFESVILKKLTFIDLRMKNDHRYLAKLLGLMPEIVHFYLTIPRSSFTLHKILFEYLYDGKNRIKTLYLNAWTKMISYILTLREMNLETLAIYDSDEKLYITLQEFTQFTNRNNLLRLNLPIKVDLSLFIELMNTFPNLQRIDFHDNDDSDNTGIHFQPEKNPVYLKITENSQSKLRSLTLIGARHHSVIALPLLNNMIFENIKNLTTLRWFNLKVVLNDEVLQNIFKYLTLLKHIRIHDLTHNIATPVTDFGFTGEKDSDDQNGYSISNLIFLETLDFNHEESCLGDPTLMHISRLKQLRSLDIWCTNGTKLAIDNLKKSCPKLERTKIRKIPIRSDFDMYMERLRDARNN